MVMLSMCKSSVVNADFDDDSDVCGEVALSYLFIYAMGFYVSFWGYGYGTLASLRKSTDPATNPNTHIPTSPQTSTTTKSKLLNLATFLKKAVFNHMLVCVYVGVLIACFPAAQDTLYGDGGFLRPLGDALRTVGEPTVAVNCIIMSGSLALTFSTNRAQQNKDEDNDDVELSIISNKAGDVVTVEAAIAQIPPGKSIFLHSFLRLIVMPAVMISLLMVAVNSGLIPKEQRLIQIIIAVEAASPSAQMMIVSLNELQIQDMAGSLAFMYLPHYCLSIFTITGWTTLAGNLIY
ncbi:hypothetical protein TrVE_jg5920 [Triparma verrucosa]|uniref:PIN-like protein n=1 Tax=Triparma verrucosa TaxID=1606542 RepID=A0A9W7CF14_9STRA|nr:hypothetical protein TrVE_jg5920 [Triparma verrucosa]